MQTSELPATGPLHPKRLGNLEKPPTPFGNFGGLSVGQNRLYEHAWNDRNCQEQPGAAGRQDPARVTADRQDPARVTADRQDTARVTADRQDPARVTAGSHDPARVTAGSHDPARVTGPCTHDWTLPAGLDHACASVPGLIL